VKYVHKRLDDPLPTVEPADDATGAAAAKTTADAAATTAAGAAAGAGAIDEATFATIRAALGGAGQAVREKVWMVSLDLPIEAPSPAEAVRRFWSYVRELGPVELPTYVSPAGDELAMQAFVLGEEANLDPEEG
jgi:hypothetical protein